MECFDGAVATTGARGGDRQRTLEGGEGDGDVQEARMLTLDAMAWTVRTGGAEMTARSSAKRKKSGGQWRRRPGRRRRFPAPCADSFGVEEQHGEAVLMARLDLSRVARSDGNAAAGVVA